MYHCADHHLVSLVLVKGAWRSALFVLHFPFPADLSAGLTCPIPRVYYYLLPAHLPDSTSALASPPIPLYDLQDGFFVFAMGHRH